MATAAQQAQSYQPLKAFTEVEIKQELKIESEEVTDPALEKKAQAFVDHIIQFDTTNQDARQEAKGAVEQMAQGLQRKASAQSAMLKQPIKNLAKRSEDGGEVANALVDLKIQVEELDPGGIDFQPGWFSRILGKIPGIGTPLKRYFTKYESAQTVINAIVRSLENGQQQLKRDNITLTEDQKRMRELTHQLKKSVDLGQLIDQKFQYALERDLAQDAEKSKFVQEELLFPLRQRIMDLQQQLAVNQQGVLSMELVMRNNKELIRGVDRAKHVTVSALEVAVTVALALADQKIVLDKIEALSATTSQLISGTAKRLRTQGAQIQKQASSTQLDLEALKKAFVDIKAAMDDITQFRLKALPNMAQSILEMDQLTDSAEKKIQEMEKANQQRSNLQIEIE